MIDLIADSIEFALTAIIDSLQGSNNYGIADIFSPG